jgi:dCMP deaminase
MGIAESTAQLSSAVRLKVGSVIVREQQILATGYNGTPTGWENVCEDIEFMPWENWGTLDPSEIWHQWPLLGKFTVDGVEQERRYRLKTKPIVLHAESNALMKIAQSTESSAGATLFCTHAPCLDCAKLIYQSGIKKVYYRDTYRDTSGLEFLNKGGVDVEKHTPGNTQG